MTAAELRAQYSAQLAEAKRLLGEGKAKDAEAAMGKADELKAQLDLALKVEAGEKFLNEPSALKAAHLGFRDSAPDEGNPVVDVKAWRSLELKTVWGEVKEIRYHVPLAVQEKGYGSAFEAYLRKGLQDMGPNDRKTLSVGVDVAGGFLVPEDQLAMLTKKIAAVTVMRQICRVMQTSRDIATWPRVNYTADDVYTSGVRVTWTGETPANATTHRVTDPVTGQISVPIRTAMASMPITNQLLEDSAWDVMGLSTDLIAESFGLGEEDVFLNGTGVAQPLGLLTEAEGNGPAAVHLGSTTVPTHAGMLNLDAALPAQYERNAKWLARKATYNTLRTAAATTSGQLLWPVTEQYGYLGVQPPTLMGYPVLKSEFVPAIASAAYAMALGDFSGYYIFDRVGLSMQRLSELYAETDITLILARKRVGGYCVEPYRIKLGQMSA